MVVSSLGTGEVQHFTSAQIHQVNSITTETPHAQLSYQDVPYDGEVMAYRPHKNITLRLASGELRHFPLNEVQQLSGFTPIIPPPPNLVPPEVQANTGHPFLAMHYTTPVERKRSAKALLIVGGAVTAVGIGMVTTGAVILKNIYSGDQDPIGAIFGMFSVAAFSPNLLAGPIMLFVGGYRYANPGE